MASKYRQTILMVLMKHELCPTQIVEKTKYPQSHVSKTLKELAAQNLVVCMNPDARKGRLYGLTKDGRKICDHIACYDK